MRKKWAVDKTGGPLLFFAELVQKKLIQHSWPCDIKDLGHTVVFKARKGRRLGRDFHEAAEVALRILGAQHRVRYTYYASGLRLAGDYVLTERGQLKCASSLSASE